MQSVVTQETFSTFPILREICLADTLDEKGESLTLNEFFNLVSQKAITHDQLQNLSVKPLKQKKTTFDGPPCIEIMQNMGIFEGSRDDVVFHYCVYAKEVWTW